MLPRLLLLAVFSFSLGCQRFNDRFDTVGSLCGVDPATVGTDEIIVKLESPKGEELTAETLLTTRSRFLLPTRQSETLTISSRGCVRIPSRAGVLQAFSSAQGWSLSQTLEARQARAFLRLPMQISPRVSAELQCPAQGIFAHKELPFPLRWTSDGALHAARFEMTVTHESQGESVVLFEKPYGQHLTELPSTMRTEDLPEGQYELRLNFHMSTEAWDVPGSIPTRTESCPLTILHRRPVVIGLDAYSLENRVAVFAKGEVIPWKTPSPQSDVVYCREKRGQDLDIEGYPETGDSCRPQAGCQYEKNFQRGGAIVADELGIFDYYAYAEDRAGNRSSLNCQTLVVTEKKPELQLLWSEAKWNQPSPQMQTPRANVQLRILARHPQLEDASLASRYQCKADFVREDQSILSGRSVICTSGRCRNQSMENFIPCDPDLNLSIVDLWPNMKAEGGTLRVFVKADDRAGHVEEQMATVGIQPQRWKPTRWSPTTTLEDSLSQLLQDRQGRIFALNYSQVFQRNEIMQTWEERTRPAEVASGGSVKAWFSQEGELHAQWQTLKTDPPQYQYLMYRLTANGWQNIPSFDPQNLEECLNPQPLNRGGFWCATSNGIALHEAGRWTVMPFPAAESGGNCVSLPQSRFLVRDSARTLWLSCNHALFQKAEGQSSWTPVEHQLPLVKLAADAQDRIWILRGTERDDVMVQVMEAGETRNLPRPVTFHAIDLRPDDFVIGPSSEIILGASYWDPQKNSWETFPYLAQRNPGQRVTPQFLGRGELVWTTEQGLMQWDGERLRAWDLAVHGLKLARNQVQAALGQDGAPWILASPGGSYEFPYQFHLKNWVYFPKPNLTPNSGIVGLWVDGQSTPRIYIANDGLYTLESGGWTRTLRSPGLNDESPVETDVFEPTLLSSNGVYRWTPEGDWTSLIRFPEPRYYWGGTRDAQGRIWVYQDSMDLGVIEGSRFNTVSLGPEAGSWVKGIFARHDGIVVATDVGMLTRSEGQTAWNTISWQDWGLETVDRIRQIDADTYFVSVTDGMSAIAEFWMLDLKTRTKKPFAVPHPAYSLGNIRKTSQGDYIVAIKFDVFRTDGQTYTKIFSERDLYSLPKVTGTFLSIWRLQLDASDRVWFDTGSGVIRIDLD